MTCTICNKPFVTPRHIRACQIRVREDSPTIPAIEHADEETHNLFAALVTDGPPEPPSDYEPPE